MADFPPKPELDAVTLTDTDRRRRRARNIAIAAILGFLVVLFYAVTVAKLGPGVLKRPM